MSDFNPREPIRLSDIDNLLEDSIFTSSNGAKLAEYLRKKRGTAGRVRLQNIFEQVAANIPKPIFNFDSSDPNPLPDSPEHPVAVAVNDAGEPSASEPVAGTSAPVQNGNDLFSLVPVKPGDPVLTPLVVVQDLKVASTKDISKPSDSGVSSLGRQALLNQYHRTNLAKCELLRQITSSTPKPEASASLNRIASFTTSISPITENDSSQIAEPGPAAPQAVIPLETPTPEQEVLLDVPVTAPVIRIDPVLPPQILAPCSQAPAESTPRKVIVVSTPAMSTSPNMVIPETPSPAKEVTESPKVAHQILPRRLSVTFNQLQEEQKDESNENITSDESEPIEEQVDDAEPLIQQEEPVLPEQSIEEKQPDTQETPAEQSNGVDQEDSENHEQPLIRDVPLPQPSAENSFVTKSILKDSFSSSNRKRHSYRVSFSQQLVQQREISPAPSVPEAHYSSCSDDSSDMSDEDEFADCEYQVIDEVYSDDGECDPNDIEENYNELVRNDDAVERQMAAIHQRIPSPLIDVVDEAPVQWFETRTPRKGQQENQDQILAPETCTKDNKTDLQLVDIITDWDDEDEEEEAEKEDQEQSPVKESQPPPVDIPETQASTQNTNVTVCNPMDITNVEDSAERLVELPPPEASFNGTVEEKRISSPERPITPPAQFTDSAKRRFICENEDALISRLQNELPPSDQQPPSPPDTPERVSETLVDIVQSLRDHPPPAIETAASRKTIIPIKKARRRKTVDPATDSYFESIVDPLTNATAAPKAKLKKKNQLTTAQRRKLYAASNGVVVKPFALLPATIRSFTIIVEKLKVGNFVERLTDIDKETIDKAFKVQQDALDAEVTGKKTDEVGISTNEQPTRTKPIRQEEETVKQQDKRDSDSESEGSESAFSGFDEHNDKESQPEALRVGIGKDLASSQDKVPETDNNEKSERQPVQNVPAYPETERRRGPRKKKTKECNNPVAIFVKRVNEPSNERLNSNEERDPLDTEDDDRRKETNAAKEIVASSADKEISDKELTPNEVPDPPVAKVEGRKPTRKKKTPESKTAEPLMEPAGSNDKPTSESGDGLSNERLNPTEGVENVQLVSAPAVLSTESADHNQEEERIISRMPLNAAQALPMKNQPRKRGRPMKRRSISHMLLDANGLRPDGTRPKKLGRPKKERIVSQTPLDVKGAPTVVTQPGKRGRPRQERIISRTPLVAEDVLPTETQARKRERFMQERIISRTPLVAEDVLPIETQPRKRERLMQERIISRMPSVAEDVLPIETHARKRERLMQKRTVPTIPLDAENVTPVETQPRERDRAKKAKPAAVHSEPKSIKKQVTFRSDEASKEEAQEDSQPETDTPLSAPSEMPSEVKNADKDAQSLPLKKRKDRIFSDDEPPTLEPFGGAMSVDSNDNVPPTLTPNDPVPGTSQQSNERNGHDVHEKYTTEKPEKKKPRYYCDVDDADETWIPYKKSLKDHYNRQVRKNVHTVARPPISRKIESEEETDPLKERRREARSRRPAETDPNPCLRSICKKPNYRTLTDEEFEELTREASRRAAEKARKRRIKAQTVSSSTNVAASDSRKRGQEDVQEPTTTKRNRSDDRVVDSQAVQPLTDSPSPSATDSERTSSTAKMEAFSWMLKLMQTNGVQCTGQKNSGLIVGGQYMHYSQEHLSCSERNGIQYSFYLHSDTENYGFMRFAPSAVKKLTKTEKFVLKFLILDGNLSIQLNSQSIQVKGGDFLMLPEYSTYAIENGKEVSLIFMIKLCPSMCEA